MRKDGKMRVRKAAAICISSALLISLLAAGCGQATPEQTVYKFLGAVQSHDRAAMRSCVNPDALLKARGGSGEVARQWEELSRRYLSEPVSWRMEFEGIRLESSYLDRDRALVSIAGGRCRLYRLREGAWIVDGKVDFSTQDFVPLYVVRRDGRWYLEALHLFVIYGLERAARA
jgi:hypothetical protein